MALDNNQFDGHGDIAQFLEKFKEQSFPGASAPENVYASREGSVPSKPTQYDRSFEKLEQKIKELEERFEASASQNQRILSELARTREAMERQKDKDAFLEHISRTIASLKASVEKLSRAQQERLAYREPEVQRSFDPVPPAFKAGDAEHTAIYHYQAHAAASDHKNPSDREEKERIISSLRQKASQLKAVNSALDREIKKAQQEKIEALRKSAEQAKEILSLRDQLTAAEERFKSFDFEGRIISIKQEYQQKVSSLENQLKEISDTCMKQVEEIESLKAENVKLHQAAAEKEAALARLEAKERELVALKEEMAQLEENNSKRAKKQLAVFSERLRALEGQRDGLATELAQAQASLDAVREEKDLLEKNFKELVEKINNNDAVIEQLKRKIEVLGQQNEELTQHNQQLSHQNEALAQHNAALQTANDTLTRERTELSLRTEGLAREKEDLSSRANDLTREKEALAERAEHLAREKNALTDRTEQLSREKEELSSRTDDLTREKEALAERAEHLAREKESLSRKAGALGEEKENLSKNVEELNLQKAALEREKAALSLESGNLKKRTEALEAETKELAKENQQLRNQSAALLAARLVQEKERAAKEETLRKAAAVRPAAPAAPHKPNPPAVPVQAASAAPAKPAEAKPAPSPKVMTEADLPEIRVADPVPQPEPLFDGEDFLEKTDSFIGRMKWSIFREDK